VPLRRPANVRISGHRRRHLSGRWIRLTEAPGTHLVVQTACTSPPPPRPRSSRQTAFTSISTRSAPATIAAGVVPMMTLQAGSLAKLASAGTCVGRQHRSKKRQSAFCVRWGTEVRCSGGRSCQPGRVLDHSADGAWRPGRDKLASRFRSRSYRVAVTRAGSGNSLGGSGLTDPRYLRPSPNVLGHLAVTNCAWKEFKELLTFRENPEDEAVHCSPMLFVNPTLTTVSYSFR
jgi:hypothetical protein